MSYAIINNLRDYVIICDQYQIDLIREALRSKSSVQVTLHNYKKDKSLFINQFFMAPIHDQQGNCQFFIGIQNCPKFIMDERRRAAAATVSRPNKRARSDSLSDSSKSLQNSSAGSSSSSSWSSSDGETSSEDGHVETAP